MLPVTLPGGAALLPDLNAGLATVFAGYATDPTGRLRVVWTGGVNGVTTLYAQAVMLQGGGLATSNALEVQVGQP